MSSITIYHNPACGTSRNVLALIRNSGVEPTVIEYLKTPPDAGTLRSLLDAMACECLVVASDTAPVRDVIAPGVDGLTVDFFDVDGLADTVAGACADRGAYAPLRKAARAKVVAEYDRRTVTEPAWMSLVDDLLARRRGQ